MTDHGLSLAPGDRIREFRIEKELGAGGFGVTYLAWDEDLERWVALKEYLPREWGTRLSDGSVGPSFSTEEHYFQWGLKKFLEEARTLARLNHPQIVRVYQVIEVRGTAYMAMEYVEGRNLKSELESVGRLGEGRVRKILDALMSGLETVHVCGILHRDIKPANIILRADDGWPVLIDFGAARQNMSRESRSLLSAMTPPYAPVEQYETDGDQGPWTDIYAVGVLAYECLTGERPAESVSRFRNDTTRPLTEVAPTVSPQLTTLVEMALKVDERDRPQDIASWRRMLDDAPPSPPLEPSWSESLDAGPPATHATPGVAKRESQLGGASSASLAVEEVDPGRDSRDGQRSEDSSDSVPSFPGAGTERKPQWIGLASRRRLVVGVGVAAAAVGGFWFASFGELGVDEATVPEMASTPISREVGPQQEPLPPGLSPADSGGIETGNGDGSFALDPQPATSPPGPSPSDGAGAPQGEVSRPQQRGNPQSQEREVGSSERMENSLGGGSFALDPQPATSPPGPSPSDGAGAPQGEVSRPQQRGNPQSQGREVGSSERMENSLAEEVGAPGEEVLPPGETDSAAVEENDPGSILPAPGAVFQDCMPGEACAFPLMVVLPPAGRLGTGPTDPLAVSVHEVTVEQWRACAQGANSCDPRVLDREGNLHTDGTGFPVVAVTWEDARAYAAWLSRRTGQPYRLLSEVEWEYMARAGTETGRYWGSESEVCRYANAWDITAQESMDSSTRAFADCEDSYANTAPVGSFTANSFGVHDALGNVEEWVENRVVRGGSWRDGPAQLGAERRSELRLLRSAYVGFRVARTLK